MSELTHHIARTVTEGDLPCPFPSPPLGIQGFVSGQRHQSSALSHEETTTDQHASKLNSGMQRNEATPQPGPRGARLATLSHSSCFPFRI